MTRVANRCTTRLYRNFSMAVMSPRKTRPTTRNLVLVSERSSCATHRRPGVPTRSHAKLADHVEAVAAEFRARTNDGRPRAWRLLQRVLNGKARGGRPRQRSAGIHGYASVSKGGG